MDDNWTPGDTFAARLVQVRRHLGLDQRSIAKQCEINAASWATWELGTKPRDMDEVVRKIAAATGCDPIWLMFGGDLPASSGRAS